MKEKIDLSECSFIDENLCYYTFFDFLEDKIEIKRLYKNLSKNGKLFYKWYVYANIHTNLIFKNAIWEYLNDDITAEQLEAKKRKYKVL